MARRPADPRLSYPGARPSVGRRVAKVVIGLAVTVALLGGAIVLVDMGLRDFAETRAEVEIKRRVPGPSVEADVTINGFSMLLQMVRGELEDVDVTFEAGADALGRLARDAGYEGDVRIADGAIALDNEIEILGAVVPFTVEVQPTLEDTGHLVLTATAVSAADAIEIDLTRFVDLGAAGVRVCSAELLPESIALTAVTVQGDTLRFTARGTSVPTDFDVLATRGECVTEESPEGDGAAESPSE